MTPVDWTSALAVLVTGLVAGAVLSRVALRHRKLEPDVDMLLRDLDERIEHAVAQLRDLKLQASKIDPTFLAEQIRELEARAAAALRERDELLARAARGDLIEAAPARPMGEARGELSPAMGFLAARPWLRGALWALGVGAVAAVLAVTVQLEQRPRQAGGPMSGGAGGPEADEAGAEAPVDPELQGLLARLREDPNDLAALLKLTRRLLRAQMFDDAASLLQRVEALAPGNAEGQVYAAVLRSAQGDTAGALTALEGITAQHPELAEAWFFRGMLGMQTGDQALMRQSFEQYLAKAPPGPQRDRVRAMLEGAAPR